VAGSDHRDVGMKRWTDDRSPVPAGYLGPGPRVTVLAHNNVGRYSRLWR